MSEEPTAETWCALSAAPLDGSTLSAWVVRPDCGASVVFTGTARDHAPGRRGVTRLEYEAYEEQVLPRLEALAAELRSRWPAVGRVALHHRVGEVPVSEAAVVVAVASPHRDEAFESARWAIDRLKATVPIWKKEHHEQGAHWGVGAHDIEDGSAATASAPSDHERDLDVPARTNNGG